MINMLRVFSLIFTISAITFLLPGIFSYFWLPEKGRILEYRLVSLGGGTYSAHPRGRVVGNNNSSGGRYFSVTYDYTKNGRLHESNFYGFFIPITWSARERYSYNEKVTVYVDPLVGRFSILEVGIDWISVFVFSFFAYISHYFKCLIFNYIERNKSVGV